MRIKTFIDRPLLSIVINVMVVAVGIIALTRLPIEKYPDIAPPTVYLWASYPGASAEAVQKSVLAPLEQAIRAVAIKKKLRIFFIILSYFLVRHRKDTPFSQKQTSQRHICRKTIPSIPQLIT